MALIKCPECGKEISEKANSCPNCGYPINKQENEEWHSWDDYTNKKDENTISNTQQSNIKEEQPQKKSANNNSASGCLLVFGLLFIGWLFISQIMDGTGDDSAEEAFKTDPEPAIEEATTEETTEINIEDLKETAEEVIWDDLYRNPETWRDKYVKIVVHVDEYETKFLGMVDTYICNVDGNMIYIMDYRDKKEPTIASGDNVLIYGKGGGMATYKVKTQNEYGVTTDSEKSKYPQINMYSAELQ